MKKFTSLTAILLCTVWITNGQWTYTELSESKKFLGSASIGDKVWFGGGTNGPSYLTDVEVYDFSTGTWAPAGNLFEPRFFVGGSVSCGTKIFFAGGYDDNVSYNIVDIYDTLTEEWTVELLSVDRVSLAAVSHGDTVMFAGGMQMQGSPTFKNTVDIYNCETGEWATPATLSQARGGIAAAVAGDLAIFAGGWINTAGTTSDKVDIYNFTTNSWSQETLSQARAYASAVAVGSKVIIAGGITALSNPTDRVDIYDAETGIWTQATLSVPRSFVDNGAAVGGKAYFAGGGNFFGNGFDTPSDVIDVYDPASDIWTVMNLQEPRVEHSVVGVGDYLVVAGGKNNSGMLSSVEIYRHPTLIHVPGDYATIQEGINEASYNDTVLVADDTYYENINFIGKPILVASEFIIDGDTNHINNTIINGSQPEDPDFGSVITFGSGEDTTSVLCGFTITGGTGTFLAVAGNARFGGGVLFFSGGKLINNSIEYNNLSNEGYAGGGGIFAGGPFDPLPWMVLRNNRINNNKAISSTNQGTGGGIEIWFNLIMENNQLSWNEATGAFRGDGGGARISGNYGHIDITISNNVFTHNKAKSISTSTDLVISGGLDIFLDVSGVVSNNIISNNEIEVATNKWGYGTGVLIETINDQEFIFENNLVTNNTFTGGNCMGGGLLIYDATGKYQNNVVQNNYGTHGGGVGIGSFNTENQPVLINNTITGNEGAYGGGLYISETNASVFNTIIWDNTAPEGASIYQEASTLEVRYSDVQGDVVWPGEGNINEEPEFQSDGYHLSNSSPLVNTGILSISINGEVYECPPYDIDGEMRPWANTQPEIGVDEVPDVSIGETISTNSLSINVYPNPAKDKITIDLPQSEDGINAQVSIYGSTGQEMICRNILTSKSEIDVSSLAPGLYFIKVNNNENISFSKFIKN